MLDGKLVSWFVGYLVTQIVGKLDVSPGTLVRRRKGTIISAKLCTGSWKKKWDCSFMK